MYRLLETLDRLHVSGFTLLEWCGVAAVLLFILVVLIKVLKRVFNVALDLRTPLTQGPLGGPPQPTGKAKILIVDDDALILEMLQSLLGKLGYNVVGVNNGEKAVDYMRKNGADLILLDLILGEGIDGGETYRQIREIRPFQRVIAMSGYANPEKVLAIRRLGIEHYLIKPVSIAVLAQAIQTELEHP